MFTQHAPKLYTWISPDGQTRNQIDYIILPRRLMSSCQLSKTLPGADCGSDHQLLMAKIKTKLKQSKVKPTVLRFDMSRMTSEYTVSVSNCFEVLLDQEWMKNLMKNGTATNCGQKSSVLASAKETLNKAHSGRTNKMLSPATIE